MPRGHSIPAVIRTSLALMGCLAALLQGTVRAGTTEQVDFFERRIRPLLAAECQECHGARKQKGGLRVDFRDGLLRGGESGPALVPGNAAGSLLVRSIRHEAPDSVMPKDRPKLSDAVVADVVAWINQGAVDPRDQPSAESAPATSATAWDVTFAARKDWWSFKPVQAVTVPVVSNPAWSTGPVDRFLLARMEARGLEPAPLADRRTLLRRVAFVLTGLPPTPGDLAAFLGDTSSEAYAKVVDQLLNSPRFGEHWARHWMDLVRFAETHGSEGDPDIPNAWRYRDYLVRAFNADVPWDRLIREHLAGDLLPDPRWNAAEGINESLLGLAHFRLVEHGFNPVDTLDEQVKTVDSQIDVVSKAFQGLTTACARCHNHKFDPIGDRDYYALHGIFASVRPTQLTLDDPARLRVNRAELEGLKERIRSGLADAWDVAARHLAETLRSQDAGDAGVRITIPGDEAQARIADLEKRLADLDRVGRDAALRARGATGPTAGLPAPTAAWTFDGDARDSAGSLHGQLEGGARIRDGRLVLDGNGAHLRTGPLEHPLREKTLEAWVVLARLDQRGGGVLTVESGDGSEFDSIVFGERDPRRWMAGSEGFRRTREAGGPEETAKSDRVVHMVAVYRADNSISLFRDGMPYGDAYTPDAATLRTFAAGSARILLGKRHTGGGSPYLVGEIEEARLYDRALGPEEIAASFRAGPGRVTPEAIIRALTAEQRAGRERLAGELGAARAEFKSRFPDYPQRDAVRTRLVGALGSAAKDASHPLHAWSRLHGLSGDALAAGWRELDGKRTEERASVLKSNRERFTPAWNFGNGATDGWFQYGANPPEVLARPGEFAVEPEGDRILAGLLPAGVFSHRLSQRHNGVFASPRFRVTNDSISLRLVGGKGARVRLIPDNYPIGQGNIFPQANLNSDAPTWVRLDTAYRKGSMAYLELATAEDVTSRDRSPAGPGGRSFFGIERVVFHDGNTPPREPGLGPDGGWVTNAPRSPDQLAVRLGDRLLDAVAAWRGGSLDEERRVLLDAFVRAGLLPATTNELPALAPLVAEYRRLESAVPLPRRAPGVVEGTAYDAPLLARGDPQKPLDPVPRGYLRLVSAGPYATPRSGRLELAEDIARASNPLTARVLANRIWHHVFGRGLVATVDNFGRLGDPPTHPELLDFLAARFVGERWSAKALIRELVLTRAFQLASDAPARAREADPSNELLSHARVRRLEAESVRDSLLAVSGRLDTAMYGPGADALAPPSAQVRRSVYLTVRRNFLSPFLETFDLPRPFTTLGKRDATNVPAQSLALLNDPFVVEQAARWAEAVLRDEPDADARIRRMFEQALARPPDGPELAASRAYLADLARARGEDSVQAVWRDYAQSLFNLKEFLYLR